MSGSDDRNFLSRWADRKTRARREDAGSRAMPPAPHAQPTETPPDRAETKAEAIASRSASASESTTVTTTTSAIVQPIGIVADAPAQPGRAQPPSPTLADVALLTPESDYARFVTAGIDPLVQRAAMKKLFSDPHFNIMDGLDTYIDDYGKSDPIPLAMLRRMNQSALLGLFDHENEKTDQNDEAGDLPIAATTPEDTAQTPVETASSHNPTPLDDDPDLRLQQDDALGRPGAPKRAAA